MKRITTLLGLVIWALLTMPIPTAGATGAAAPSCPLQADHVVELTSDYLLGWKDTRRSLGPFPGLVPPGEYQLELVSWDDHSSKPHQDHVQPQEVWFLSALDAAGVEVARTANTPDLPGDLDMAVFDMGTVVVAAEAVQFTAYHGFHDDWNPNSVSPLCAGFTTVSQPQPDSPATAAPAEGEPVPQEEEAPLPPASDNEPLEATSQPSPSETAVAEESAPASAAPGVASPPAPITATPVPAASPPAESTPATSQPSPSDTAVAEESAPIAPAPRAATPPARVTAAPVPAVRPLPAEVTAPAEPAWLPPLTSLSAGVQSEAATRVMGVVVPLQVTELPETGAGIGGLSALAVALMAAGLLMVAPTRLYPGNEAG